jgi:hypothetical protein
MAIQQFQEDELDDVKPQTAPSSAKTQNKAAAPAPAPTPIADEDADFGDEGYMKSDDFLTVIKPDKGKVIRFAFVPGFKLKHSRVHYLEGTGSFRCISPKDGSTKEICCERGGNAKDRFVGLVFVYTNADTVSGKLPTGVIPEVAVQAVRLSRSNYREITNQPDEDSNVYAIDLIMRHDESRAFGYKFNRATPTARWRQVEPQAMALAEPFKTDQAKLASRLGKNLTRPELIVLLGGKGVKDAEGRSVDIDDI